MPSANPDPRIGMTLGGKYELLRKLGAGGMGVVYEAVNALTGRRVAVKLLLGDAVNAHVRQRLLQEARAAARIQHPNVVDVLDVAVDPDAGPFLVMELLDGESLEERLVRDGALSFGEVASLLRPVAEALQLAHDAGIVHRDIKPSNIFLHTDPRGEVSPKLVDFGIARTDGPRITRSGVMAGTVGYMAPEQMHDAKRADQRSDIWSLAVVVYECFAGKSPFLGTTAVEVMSSVLSGRLLPLDEAAPATPQSVVNAVHRALTIDAAARPASVTDFIRLAGFEQERSGGVATRTAPPPPQPHSATALMSTLPMPAVETAVRPVKSPRGRQRVFIGVGLAGLVAVLTTVLGRAWRDGAALSEAAHSAPTPVARGLTLGPRLPAPAVESRVIAGGQGALGSSLDEVRAAVQECASEAGSERCAETRFAFELPPTTREVREFALGRHEVTVEQLFAWLSRQSALRTMRDRDVNWVADAEGTLAALASPSTPEAGISGGAAGVSMRFDFARRPATWVTQRAARLFCESVGGRLPTSVEWEWAARGEARRRYPWGNAFFGCHRAVAARATGKTCGAAGDPSGATDVLEQLQDQTPEGVVGLAGNVAEWVADAAPSNSMSQGERCAGSCFVVRGGDWASDAVQTRGAGRRAFDGSRGAGWVGFRCAFDRTRHP